MANRWTTPAAWEARFGTTVASLILNGVESVGKTSTARALQAIAVRPFMHVSMDSFLDMLPERVFGQCEGLVFERVPHQGRRCVAITTGPVVDRSHVRHA